MWECEVASLLCSLGKLQATSLVVCLLLLLFLISKDIRWLLASVACTWRASDQGQCSGSALSHAWFWVRLKIDWVLLRNCSAGVSSCSGGMREEFDLTSRFDSWLFPLLVVEQCGQLLCGMPADLWLHIGCEEAKQCMCQSAWLEWDENADSKSKKSNKRGKARLAWSRLVGFEFDYIYYLFAQVSWLALPKHEGATKASPHVSMLWQLMLMRGICTDIAGRIISRRTSFTKMLTSQLSIHSIHSIGGIHIHTYIHIHRACIHNMWIYSIMYIIIMSFPSKRHQEEGTKQN